MAPQDIQVIPVIDRHIEFCSGCLACMRNGGVCHHNDDMRSILEQIFASSDSKVINFNRYGNKIFIITEGGTNPGLYRINTDGSRLEYIAAGEILSVNCTSLYTFFQYYTDEYTLYRVPTSGNIVSIEEITIK